MPKELVKKTHDMAIDRRKLSLVSIIPTKTRSTSNVSRRKREALLAVFDFNEAWYILIDVIQDSVIFRR